MMDHTEDPNPKEERGHKNSAELVYSLLDPDLCWFPFHPEIKAQRQSIG